MKKVVLLLSILLFFGSCGKDEQYPSSNPTFTFDWKWHARVPSSYLRPLLDPILYKNWVILAYTESIDFIENGPTLIAYDKHTGHVAWQYTNPTKNNESLKNWKISGDHIILKYSNRLLCLNAENRSILWETFFTPNEDISIPMEVYGDFIYMELGYQDAPGSIPFSDSVSLVRYHIPTGQNETIYGERKKDGTEHYPEVFPPVIYNDGQRELAIFQRYINDSEDIWPVDIVAVDIKTKKVVWRDTSFSPDWGSRFTPPRILDGNVIACSDHSIYSWNASTGKRNWKKALFTGSEKISFTTTGPFIHDGKIFVFEFGGHGFCLNPENGQTLWETYTTIQKDYGPAYGSCLQPIIVNDVLLVNAESSRLFLAYDARNGHLLQQFKDATYNGTNVIFDEETETCFVLADEKLKAFKVER